MPACEMFDRYSTTSKSDRTGHRRLSTTWSLVQLSATPPRSAGNLSLPIHEAARLRTCQLGDEVFKVQHNDTIVILLNDHAQVSAPGYGCGICGLSDISTATYTGFEFTEDHAWTLSPDDQGWKPEEIKSSHEYTTSIAGAATQNFCRTNISLGTDRTSPHKWQVFGIFGHAM